jgi:ppGpp synthetase/RelA/SpoT-type nucleotidyltranferase
MDVDSTVTKYEKELHSIYTDFAVVVKEVIRQAVTAQGVKVHSIDPRAKGANSLRLKILSAEPPYTELRQVTDLAGVRVIVYFPSDVDRIVDIAENFDVDRENSEDKRKTIDPDHFGYSSVHYIVELDQVRAKQVEYRRFAGLKCEIQIRTILQHAWAEIEHDIGYKSRIDVPAELRRRFAVLSGLLELADREFETIRKEEESLRLRIARSLGEDKLGIAIDMVSVTEYFKGKQIGQHSLENIDPTELSELIGEMRGMEIRDLKTLNDAILGFDLDINLLEKELRKIRSDLGLHPAGAVRVVLARAHPTEFRRVMEEKLENTTGRVKEFNRQLTSRILLFVTKSNIHH